ncbi:MAG: NAAT family transporter [Rhodospirillales bacterium]|nr:NAAT family transporter [Rhodospirillales bacterium]
MIALRAFLLAFPALFSVVNPLGMALIFQETTAEFGSSTQQKLARQVAFYGALVMLISAFAGSYVLTFFGISLAALRLAGGAVVAVRAWELLAAPEAYERRKSNQAVDSGQDSIAFYPLTMPLTTGPGTMAVAVALGAERPAVGMGLVGFLAGLAVACAAVAVTIWLSFGSAPRIARWLRPTARQTLSRLAAFLLMCIGVQIMIHGLADVLAGHAGL